MDNSGQPSSNDFLTMARTNEEYWARKARVEEAKVKLRQMEREIELQEIARKGREAEQQLAQLRTSATRRMPITAGPSIASGSSHPHYQSVEEVPLTARIEGEVHDPPANSSRQASYPHYTYQHSYPATRQPLFQANAPQMSNQPPPQVSSYTQTQSTMAQHAYARAPTYAVDGYQHPLPTSSTPNYFYQQPFHSGQPSQQQRPTEEYWALQSQKYSAELAAAGAWPQARTSSAGEKPQAILDAGSSVPKQNTPVHRQIALSAAPSEAASDVPPTQHPMPSTETKSSVDHQSSSNHSANPAITKRDFIQRFQCACMCNEEVIRVFLSSMPVSVEWLTEAVSNVDPANLKDAGAASLLNEMRNHLKVPAPPINIPASSSNNVNAPLVIDTPAKPPTSTVQPSPPPTSAVQTSPPPTSAVQPSPPPTLTVQPSPPPTVPSSAQQTPANIPTKESYVQRFHDINKRSGVDQAADFLVHNASVPREWHQAVFNSLSPELLAEMRPAWYRTVEKVEKARAGLQKAQQATQPQTASSSAAKPNAPPSHAPHIVQQNRSQTVIPNVVTQSTPTATEPSKLVPVPPRPSVTKSSQGQPASVKPSQASTTKNHTTATAVAASVTEATRASRAQASTSGPQTAPSAPSARPLTTTPAPQSQLLAGAVSYQGAADSFRPYSVPPPMSVPSANGMAVEYVYDANLKKYIRKSIVNGQAVPAYGPSKGMNNWRHEPAFRYYTPPQFYQNGSGQPPMPRSVPAPTQSQSTQAATLQQQQQQSSGSSSKVRTPQQADKSRLARDILRSLGMNAPPVMLEGEEESEVRASMPTTLARQQETAVVRNNVPATTVHQQGIAPFSQEPSATNLLLKPPVNVSKQEQQPHAQDLSTQEALHETTLSQPPSNVTMEKEEQPPAQSLLGPTRGTIVIDLTMDNDPSNVLMEHEQQPQPRTSPNPTTEKMDFMVDEELGIVTGNGDTSLILPPAVEPASSSTEHDDLTRGVDEMSIAIDVHHPEPSQEGGHMDSPISFLDMDEPVLPVREPASVSSPAPSFRAQSREQSEQIGHGVLPLFLPSPSASPPPTDYSGAPLPPETDDEGMLVESIRGGATPSKRRANSDILVLDEERSVTPPRNVKRREGQRVYVLVPPPPPELRRVIKKRKLEENGIVSGSEGEEETKYNDFEEALIADCKVRMVERHCQWRGCDAVMNSGENLYLHLKLHTQEASSQGLHTCRWQSCPLRFKSSEALEKHLRKHSYFPLPCSLANCSDVFNEPFEAMEHEVRHQQREPVIDMKQPPNPHVAKLPAKLDPPPNVLPSYRVEPRYIRQAHITAHRHAVIGPWVLQHIFSPVEQNLRKQNAPMRLRYPRQDARPEDLDNLRARPDEYDFLASLSTSPMRTIRYDDLDSAEMSQALHEGLTLWGVGADSNSHQTKSGEGSNLMKDIVVVDVREGSESHSVGVEESGDSTMAAVVDGVAAGEEEAVEMML